MKVSLEDMPDKEKERDYVRSFIQALIIHAGHKRIKSTQDNKVTKARPFLMGTTKFSPGGYFLF